MVPLFNIVACLSLASIALSSPLSPNFQQRNYNASTPCAQVGAAIAGKNVTQGVTVPAALAYECITSVPFNQTAALALVDGVVPYFKFQSNTVWLADPPAEYAEKVQPATNIWDGLKRIREKVVAGDYDNEYEFGFELYRLLQMSHDGHFIFVPDIIGTVFTFARPLPIVSVSSDGQKLPDVYAYPDVLSELSGNATFTPSPITHIDDQDAQKFLENWAQYGSLQDRDALYNNVFYELAAVSYGTGGPGIGTFAGSGRGRWIYPGASTKLTFANGTSQTYDNFAKVLIPFDGISDGESLYKLWFTGNQPGSETTTNSTSATPTPSATPSAKPVPPIPAPGYPPPVLREEHNLIGGYYLEDDYSDVAVLSVPSFVGIDNAAVGFQATAEKFLAAAKAAGKKKLVIDVSANGGGTILLGYDLYKLLFPDKIDHAAADRFRAHEATELLTKTFSQAAEGIPRVYNPDNKTLSDLEDNVVSALFNYRGNLDINLKNFESWQEFYGPGLEQKGDNFSSLFRWNLSDVLIPLNSGGVYVHGYGPLSNYTQAPFAAEDVVVVTDGYCASTCTIFSELMRQRAGVKYISLGGRSREGITQAVGGVKGTNDYPWTYIQSLAQYAVDELSSTEEGAQLNKTELGKFYDNTPMIRGAVGIPMNVNFRDGIRDGDKSETPLQFIYEPADCRILYTKAMTVDVTAIWKAVADTTWGSVNHCVAGNLSAYATLTSKREMSVSERSHSKRMANWRASLKAADYPLDIRTDLSQANLDIGEDLFALMSDRPKRPTDLLQRPFFFLSTMCFFSDSSAAMSNLNPGSRSAMLDCAIALWQ
ncbi:peptidase s41 family [Pyrenophora seminiperda CCB06]|uniref:Peptidase s41 family n=1 Tax=Pyrenophora seminiperda CCB06 TaxID=1302712 RepID=A0A3M7M2D4_9PLEO|nr:peptidase s41 family [Pyrenophora seminiperda CCB06]